MVLLNFMILDEKGNWRRTSTRIHEGDYEALCYLAERDNISPTAYLELAGILFKNSPLNNFTAFLRQHMFQELLKELQSWKTKQCNN